MPAMPAKNQFDRCIAGIDGTTARANARVEWWSGVWLDRKPCVDCTPPAQFQGCISKEVCNTTRACGSPAVGAYANGFVTVKAGATSENGASDEYRDLSPEDYVRQADEYMKLGASIVGGCCGVFPEHIEAVASKHFILS